MPTERTRQKRRVYLNEYNILMDNCAYLPFVSGILKSYSEQFSPIKENYQFEPFLFHRDRLRTIVQKHENPSVAAFSVSMWNEQLALKVAQQVKEKFPDCLIIFGGPHVPYRAEDYFREHPFIDVTVRGEGEEGFAEVLIRFLEARDFVGIPGISYRDPKTKKCARNEQEREQSKDLDIYPSPYLAGCFDYLFDAHPDFRFQAIIETNRGCPFPCSFCFWGQGGLSRKYRFHSLERVEQMINWCGEKKIEYLFNADSNFGMHPRDYQISEFLVNAKKKYGYPDKFRTCFGKNTDEKIFQVAHLLHAHGLEKGITLARQSNDEAVLKNVNRQNIKLETYKKLQLRFNECDIPVYSELILGLPGETYQTWLSGIDEILDSGIKNQLFVYHAQVYPNTDFGEKWYQEKFQIKTTRVPLQEPHAKVRPDYLETEYEDIITQSLSMNEEDWKRMTVVAWLMQLFHSLKIAYYVMIYLHERLGVKYSDFLTFIAEKKMSDFCGGILKREVLQFEEHAQNIFKDRPKTIALPEFGDIYWEFEEASFLNISNDLEGFYEEMQAVVLDYLHSKNIPYNLEEIQEVIDYQRIRIPRQQGFPLIGKRNFQFNFPEFFGNYFTPAQVPLQKCVQTMELAEPKDFSGDKKNYAKQIIIWGRKSGTMMNKVRWEGHVLQNRSGSPRYSLGGF